MIDHKELMNGCHNSHKIGFNWWRSCRKTHAKLDVEIRGVKYFDNILMNAWKVYINAI